MKSDHAPPIPAGATPFEDDLTKFVDTTPIDVPDRPRILIVKLWAIGDILMATPLLRALRRAYPGCRISWLVDQRYASILEGNPFVDEVVAFDSPLWRKYYRYGMIFHYLKMSIDTRRDLLQRKFDVVINLTAEKWWVVWFQVAPIRIGLFPRANPGLMGRLYTKAIPRSFSPLLHNSRHYVLPAPALGITGPFDLRMSAPERDVDDAAVVRFLEAHPAFDPNRPIVVLHPGTSQASKCWPTEYFAALIDRFGSNANVIITGSPDERPLAERIAAERTTNTPAPIIGAGGLAHLGETTALVRRAAVVVTGDTSMLHIASAVDVPVVAIYGSTRPDDNVPLFGKQSLVFNPDVACSPCGHARCPLPGADHMKCMRTISPDRVFEAVTAIRGRMSVT